MPTPVEEIKSRLDIVDIIGGYLRLQKAGINFKALCPFHGEKTPSFFVSPERQSWHCFGCGKGGDMFSFIQEMDGVEFIDALRILAQRAGVELRRQDNEARSERGRLEEANELAANFFEAQLARSVQGTEATRYLTERAMNEESTKNFRLGFAPQSRDALLRFLFSKGFSYEEIVKAGLAIKRVNADSTSVIYDRFRGRIMFPIFDTHGRILGFTGRIFGREASDGEPKYLNTPETPIFDKGKILYGLDKAKTAIRTRGLALLVEGQMDLIMAHQAGVANAVATSGTALTEHHLKTIKRYADAVSFVFDADKAGDLATKRGLRMALKTDLRVKGTPIYTGKDPADMVKESPDAFVSAIENDTQPIFAFLIQRAAQSETALTIDGRVAFFAEILPLIKIMDNAIEQAEWIQRLTLEFHVREESIWEQFNKTVVDKDLLQKDASPSLAKEMLRVSSRRRQIEEYLLMLLLRASSDHSMPRLGLSAEQFTHYFVTPSVEAIARVLLGMYGRENVSDYIAETRKELASEHTDVFDAMTFEASMLDPLTFELEQEIERCIREIRMLELRERLDALSTELAVVERSGNTLRLAEIENEFTAISQELTQLLSNNVVSS